jgi:hypothetical protein
MVPAKKKPDRGKKQEPLSLHSLTPEEALKKALGAPRTEPSKKQARRK